MVVSFVCVCGSGCVCGGVGDVSFWVVSDGKGMVCVCVWVCARACVHGHACHIYTYPHIYHIFNPFKIHTRTQIKATCLVVHVGEPAHHELRRVRLRVSVAVVIVVVGDCI